jgi:ketosteroid isomerase-like protein
MAAERDSASAEITALTQDFARWLTEGSIDSAATRLTDDYHALAPNQPTVSGKAAWVEWTRQSMGQGRLTMRHAIESLEVNGPIAVTRGQYTSSGQSGATTPGSAPVLADTGKSLWHWRKVDGRWLLAAAAWSSDLPVKP